MRATWPVPSCRKGPCWALQPDAKFRLFRQFEPGGTRDCCEAFASAVRNGRPLLVTASPGATILAILDAARKSALEGRSITL